MYGPPKRRNIQQLHGTETRWKTNSREDRNTYKLNFLFTAVEIRIVVVGFMTPCSLVVNANSLESQILFNLEDGSKAAPKCYCIVWFGKCGLTFLAGKLFPSRNHFELKMQPLCSSNTMNCVPDVLHNRKPGCFIFRVEVTWTLKTISVSSSKCWYPRTRLHYFLSQEVTVFIHSAVCFMTDSQHISKSVF